MLLLTWPPRDLDLSCSSSRGHHGTCRAPPHEAAAGPVGLLLTWSPSMRAAEAVVVGRRRSHAAEVETHQCGDDGGARARGFPMSSEEGEWGEWIRCVHTGVFARGRKRVNVKKKEL